MKLLLPELHYNLGHVLHQQGNLVGAVMAYRQAIALEPTFAQAHHSLAVVLGEQGQHEAAIDHYKQVIALKPSATKAYNNLGCIFVEQGRIAEALQMYRRAIALEPSATLHINLGKAITAEDPVAAVAAYRRAVELEPDSLSARYNLGHALQQQGQHSAAIECFQQVLHQDSSHPSAHTGCGLAYMSLGQLDRALDHFRQALLPQQAYVKAFCEWADRTCGIDELSLARKACGQFLQTLLQPTDSRHQSNSKRSIELVGASRPEAATIEDCAHQQAQQQLAQTYLHLGNVLTQYGGMKQCQQAEIYYQKALQIRSQDLEIYLRLGACLSQQQRWNAASMLYRLALTLHPNAPQLYQNLGQLLERQQRWAEAISYYRQALQLTDDSHPPTVSPNQPSDSKIAASNHPDCKQKESLSKTAEQSEFSGFYASTQNWITQNQSGQYVALPDLAEIAENAIVLNILEASTPQPTSSTSACPPAACDGLNCNRCLRQIIQQFAPLHMGHGVYACQPEGFHSAFRPFVAEVPQAQAWMIPYRTAWMITSAITVLSPDRAVLADLSREYPGQLPGCCQADADRFAQIQDIWKANQVNVEPIAGRVAVLAGLSGHNYFHWMVDILPRFALLQQSGIDLADVDWFWINNPQQPFQQETLRHLGIPSEKILAGDRHPQIQAEQLIVPSFAGNLGWIEPWALQFLRRQLLKLADSSPLPRHERIYISRTNAHHRRVLNESAVLERLQKAGFVSVALETLTLAEQIALFHHAKVIIAPHGGGLTNLLFCSLGTQVVEFVAPQYVRHYYWVISQQLGLRHFFLTGEELACAPIQRLMYPSPLMEDIWVNLTALDAVLNQLDLTLGA